MHFKDKSRYFSYLFHYCLDKFLIFLGCRVIWTFIPFVCCNIFQSIIHLISCFFDVAQFAVLLSGSKFLFNSHILLSLQNSRREKHVSELSCRSLYKQCILSYVFYQTSKQVHQLRNFPPCFTSGQSSNWLFIR